MGGSSAASPGRVRVGDEGVPVRRGSGPRVMRLRPIDGGGGPSVLRGSGLWRDPCIALSVRILRDGHSWGLEEGRRTGVTPGIPPSTAPSGQPWEQPQCQAGCPIPDFPACQSGAPEEPPVFRRINPGRASCSRPNSHQDPGIHWRRHHRGLSQCCSPITRLLVPREAQTQQLPQHQGWELLWPLPGHSPAAGSSQEPAAS